MGKSVLTLETIEPDRDFITIDGKPFYLRADDELSTSDVAKVRRMAKKVTEGMSENATDDQIAEMDDQADRVLDVLVISLPPEMKGKLKSAQKFLIVQAFTSVASRKRAEKATEQERESQKTMDGSSPGSSDSTGDPSATG